MLLFLLACGDQDISEVTNDLVGQWLTIDTETESAVMFLVPGLTTSEGELWYLDSYYPYPNPTDNDYGGLWHFESDHSIRIEFSEGLQDDLYAPVGELTFEFEPLPGNCYAVSVMDHEFGMVCPFDGIYRTW